MMLIHKNFLKLIFYNNWLQLTNIFLPKRFLMKSAWLNGPDLLYRQRVFNAVILNLPQSFTDTSALSFLNHGIIQVRKVTGKIK